MIRELKYLLFIIIIFFFFFFLIRYYFSDVNHKNSYRSHLEIDKKIEKEIKNLIVLKNNTENIIEFVEIKKNKETKKYTFWDLLYNDN